MVGEGPLGQSILPYSRGVRVGVKDSSRPDVPTALSSHLSQRIPKGLRGRANDVDLWDGVRE